MLETQAENSLLMSDHCLSDHCFWYSNVESLISSSTTEPPTSSNFVGPMAPNRPDPDTKHLPTVSTEPELTVPIVPNVPTVPNMPTHKKTNTTQILLKRDVNGGI